MEAIIVSVKTIIVDAHTHIASWPTIKASEDALAGSMDRFGIAFSLVSDCDAGEYADKDSEYKAQPKKQLVALRCVVNWVKKYPAELGAAIWIRPHKETVNLALTDFIKENRRYIYALKIHPFYSHMKMNDRHLLPYFALAKKFGLPILVHSAADKYSDIHILAKVARENPDLTFVAAHMNLLGDNQEAIEEMKKTPNLYGDTAWVKMDVAYQAMKEVGKDRIIFGTDNPIDGPDTLGNEMYQEYFKNSAKMPKEMYADLMAHNAIKVYKLPLKIK